MPSGGISAFGPLIISTLLLYSRSSGLIFCAGGFGFDQFKTILFNIPFSALQVIATLFSAWISTRIKLKWPVLVGVTLPPIAGASALYALGREPELRNKLLGCYYVVRIRTPHLFRRRR